MRFALLLGASSNVNTPVSRIPAGSYNFCVEGHKDSLMSLHTEIYAPVDFTHGQRIELHKATTVQVKFDTKGTEKNMNVILERVA